MELTEINLAQLKAAHNDKKESDEDKCNTNNLNELSQLKDEEERIKKTLQERDSEVSRLTLENEEHLKRVSELTAYIQQASQDREQIIQQYTSYSQQLASQIETLTQQLNVKASENHGMYYEKLTKIFQFFPLIAFDMILG